MSHQRHASRSAVVARDKYNQRSHLLEEVTAGNESLLTKRNTTSTLEHKRAVLFCISNLPCHNQDQSLPHI
jgi:hypothetical protein